MKEYKITKERLKAMAKKCPQAEGILKKGFPEAFEEGWVDISSEIKWNLRSDGVLQMSHPKADDCIGHLWVDGEFYWTNDDYKQEIEKRELRILKRRGK